MLLQAFELYSQYRFLCGAQTREKDLHSHSPVLVLLPAQSFLPWVLAPFAVFFWRLPFAVFFWRLLQRLEFVSAADLWGPQTREADLHSHSPVLVLLPAQGFFGFPWVLAPFVFFLPRLLQRLEFVADRYSHYFLRQAQPVFFFRRRICTHIIVFFAGLRHGRRTCTRIRPFILFCL